MLAISSEYRKKKVEELVELKSYAEKAAAIFNVRDDKFSKDTALDEVKNLLKKAPSSKFCSPEVAQISDIMKRFCNGNDDEIEKDTAAFWLLSALDEVTAIHRAYEQLGPVEIYKVNFPKTES